MVVLPGGHGGEIGKKGSWCSQVVAVDLVLVEDPADDAAGCGHPAGPATGEACSGNMEG